jgi:hypothetical protein
MSRGRLPRAEKDLYSRHPLRIVRALKTGELDPLGYLLIKFLVDETEAPGRSGETIVTLEELARLIGWSHSHEYLRQKLHGLREAGWIDFDEPRRARNAAWTFRLKGAAIDGETHEPPTVLQLQTPSELEVTSNYVLEETPAVPLSERVSESYAPPTAFPPRAEQRRAEIKTVASEENKEHLVGKTTRHGDLRLGDEGYPELVLAEAVLDGHITQAEAESRYEFHKLVVLA